MRYCEQGACMDKAAWRKKEDGRGATALCHPHHAQLLAQGLDATTYEPIPGAEPAPEA
jgi:hypothetical protein